jgi:hypothetical protein
MPAGEHNLYIEQGTTYSYSFTKTVYDPDNPPNYDGLPFDLTGYTARAQIRKAKRTPTFFIELTTENGGIVLGGALGTIDLYISATDTAALNFTTGVWDLELEKNGVVERLLEGIVTLSKEVTRSIELT